MNRNCTGITKPGIRLLCAGSGLLVFACLAIGNGGTPAAEPTMLERSPFIPPGFSPPQSGRAAAKASNKVSGYEFRGIYQLGSSYRFLVSEPRSRNGSWVEVGGDYEGYEVREYDPDTETLTLFFNNSENQLQLADLESNPTPLPVSGQIQQPKPTPKPAQPVRRTIRPANRTPQPTTDTSNRATPPPPAWLQQLRQEAESRRNQATGGLGSSPPGGDTFTPSGAPTQSAPPPPTELPPTPPPNLTEMDIPPPPTELPPPPPPEILQKIQESMSSRPPSP